MEHVPSDSESTKREGMLQSNDLFRLLHKYYTDIMTLQKEVKDIPKRFPRGKNITDVQCSRITDSLSKLEQPVKDFYRLLDTHKTYPPLPITVEPHRHSLLIILNSIDKNLNDLKRLINGYPAVSQRASSELAMAQHIEIFIQL